MDKPVGVQFTVERQHEIAGIVDLLGIEEHGCCPRRRAGQRQFEEPGLAHPALREKPKTRTLQVGP